MSRADGSDIEQEISSDGNGSRDQEESVGSVLTQRQSTMLVLLAQGNTNREIAEALGCSERHVRRIQANVRTATGAKTNEQAIARAMRLGLIKSREGDMPGQPRPID